MTQGVLFRPTEEQRRTARAMAGYGMPHVDIASFFDIDAKTLRKHFGRELDLGSIEATAKVAQSLFRMATEGKNVAAAIFWMKARAGWREKQPEALIADEQPVEEMSDEELEKIIRETRRAGSLPKTNITVQFVSAEPSGSLIDGKIHDVAAD